MSSKTDAILDVSGTKDEAINSETNVSKNLVDFDGPADLDNALNWSKKRKWSVVFITSFMTFITSVSTLILAPAAPQILSDLHSSDKEITVLLVSIWELGEAFAPLFLAPLSETYGRVLVYHTANVLFIIASACSAVSVNVAMLSVFRFLNGVAVGTVAMNAAIVGDIFIQEQRGVALAAGSLPVLFSPIVGPISGGYITQNLGWRWTCWLSVILAGACELAFLILFRQETYKVVTLRRKATRLRRETGNDALRCAYDGNASSTDVIPHTTVLWTAIKQPVKMLLTSQMLLLLAVYGAINYGYIFIISTTITTMFETKYAFSAGAAGLTFAGMGIGIAIGVVIYGATSDRLLKKLSSRHDGHMKPEYRLPHMVLGGITTPIGFFIYGWTAEFHARWIAPVIGTGIIGCGAILISLPLSNYLVDAFRTHAASGQAAALFMRCIVGSLLPLSAVPLYKKLGYGWGNSVLGFITLAFVPVPIMFFKFGERIRTNSKYHVVA